MKLKIGCLDGKVEGYTNIDIDPKTGPDIVADACDMHMIRDGSVDEILCDNVLEHIPDTLRVMKEFHRVLKPGGRLTILAPHALNPDLFSTPDHYKGFTYTTFNQFWQEKHRNYPRFKCVRRRLLTRNRVFQPLADRFPLKMEHLHWLFTLDSVYVELKAIK